MAENPTRDYVGLETAAVMLGFNSKLSMFYRLGVYGVTLKVHHIGPRAKLILRSDIAKCATSRLRSLLCSRRLGPSIIFIWARHCARCATKACLFSLPAAPRIIFLSSAAIGAMRRPPPG